MHVKIHDIETKLAELEGNPGDAALFDAVKKSFAAWQTERLTSWDSVFLNTDYLQNVAPPEPTHATSASNLLCNFMSHLENNKQQVYVNYRQRWQTLSAGKSGSASPSNTAGDAEPPGLITLTEIENIHRKFLLDEGFRPIFVFPEKDGGVTLVGDGKGQVVRFSQDGERIWNTFLDLKKPNAAYTLFESHLPGCKNLLLYLLDRIVTLNCNGKIISEISSPCPFPTSAFLDPVSGRYHLQSSVDGKCSIYNPNWQLIKTYDQPGGRHHSCQVKRSCIDEVNNRVLAVVGGKPEEIRPLLLAAYDLDGTFLKFLHQLPTADSSPILCVDGMGLIHLGCKHSSIIHLDSEGRILPGQNLSSSFCIASLGRIFWMIDRNGYRVRAFDINPLSQISSGPE